MPTSHTLRVLILAPQNRVNAIATWFRNNIGPNSVPVDLGPGLSASGNLPVTHRWMCGSYEDEEARLLLRQLCVFAGIPPLTPAQWAGRTRAAKVTWLRGVRDAVRAAFGVFVALSNNEGDWDEPEEALGALGLVPVSAVP